MAKRHILVFAQICCRVLKLNRHRSCLRNNMVSIITLTKDQFKPVTNMLELRTCEKSYYRFKVEGEGGGRGISIFILSKIVVWISIPFVSLFFGASLTVAVLRDGPHFLYIILHPSPQTNHYIWQRVIENCAWEGRGGGRGNCFLLKQKVETLLTRAYCELK